MLTRHEIVTARSNLLKDGLRTGTNKDTMAGLAILADMAEELDYTDQQVLEQLRSPAIYNNLHWWALGKVREHFEEK